MASHDHLGSWYASASPLTRSDIRALVFSFVAMLKREGHAPERVVVAIKELARTAIMPGLLGRHEREPGKIAREEITDLMVRCCIEAYYDETPAARAAHIA